MTHFFDIWKIGIPVQTKRAKYLERLMCSGVVFQIQIAGASTDNQFRQVVSDNGDWLAGLGYCLSSLNISVRDSLIRELIKHELYNKYESIATCTVTKSHFLVSTMPLKV